MTTRSYLDEMIREVEAEAPAPIHLVQRAAEELAALRALVKELTEALQATLNHLPVSAAIALAPKVDAALAKARQQA